MSIRMVIADDPDLARTGFRVETAPPTEALG